jgi:hypothetical protein
MPKIKKAALKARPFRIAGAFWYQRIFAGISRQKIV